MNITWEAVGASDVGRRRRGNEDSFSLDPDRGIFVVADGMGGHAGGEIASDLAVTTAMGVLTRALDELDDVSVSLERASYAAHSAIEQCCAIDRRLRGMGTTLTACVLDRAGHCWVGHIGDSRLYRLRGDRLEQITDDHTWVQREIDAGRLTVEAARQHPLSHILTRVLSEESSPDLDLLTGSVLPGDLLLLGTDGLYNMVDDDTLAALLRSDAPLPRLAESLIDAANQSGGADNITVILVRILNVEF